MQMIGYISSDGYLIQERPKMDQLRDTDFTGIPFLMHVIRSFRTFYGVESEDAIRMLRSELQYIKRHYAEEEVLENKNWLPTFVKESCQTNG